MAQEKLPYQVRRTSFRLKDSAYEKLVKSAEEAGISAREWLEEAILGNRTRIVERRKPSADIQALVVQVNRAGNNLNQIAHRLNTAALAGDLDAAKCEEALQRVDHMRALLNEALRYARQG